jgi:O-antigen ligase
MTAEPEVAAGERSSRPTRFDTVLVVVLALSVFCQRVDYVLWVEKGFPVPDITYVVVATILLGRAAVLYRRGSLPLVRPDRRELTLLAFLLVVAATSLAAAAVGAAKRTTPAPPKNLMQLDPVTAHASYPVNAAVSSGGAGGTLLVRPRPRARSQLTFNTSNGIPYAVVPGKPYTFSVSARAARGTPRITLFLIQRAGGRVVGAAGRVTRVSSARWVRARVTVTTAPGLLTVSPVVAIAPSPTPSSLSLREFQLVGASHPVLAGPSSSNTTAGLRVEPVQSLKTLLHLAFLVVVALVLGRMLTLPLLRSAFVSFFLFSVAVAFVAIAQALDQNLLHLGVADALRLVSRPSGSFDRPVSVFSEPAYLGYFSLAGAAVGLWLYSLQRMRWIAAGIGVCLAAVLLAASAGPIVAAVPVLVYIAWRAAPILKRMWRSLAVAAIVVIVLLVVLPAGSTLVDRASAILSGSDASASLRYALDKASITIWQLSPATGVGLGNVRFYLPDLVHFSFTPGAVYSYQEANAYLGMLAECGILGLAALVAVMVSLLVPISGASRGLDWITSVPILMFAVAFFFIGGLIAPMFWFWVGLRLAAANQAGELATLETAETSRRMRAAIAS